MRMLHNGSAPSFQVGGAGSIPVIRSSSSSYNGRRAVSETDNAGPIPALEATTNR